MSILSELTTLISSKNLPVETGRFSAKPPRKYVVLTPLYDEFSLHADNIPCIDTSEVRISLFVLGNYLPEKNTLITALITAGYTITERRYAGYDDDTGYHNYSVDVAKAYQLTQQEEGN